MGLAKGQVQRREELGQELAGPQCLGAAHTHPSGVSAELTALSTCVGSSLCFPSLSLGLMNRPLAIVGLSV